MPVQPDRPDPVGGQPHGRRQQPGEPAELGRVIVGEMAEQRGLDTGERVGSAGESALHRCRGVLADRDAGPDRRLVDACSDFTIN